MPGRGTLVDARGQRPHLGHLLGDLLAHQVAAEADLAALADEELHRVGQHQVVGVEAVAALDELVVPLGGQVALGRDHGPPSPEQVAVPAIEAPLARAILASSDSAPKLMPVMYTGTSSSRGLAAKREPITVLVSHFSR